MAKKQPQLQKQEEKPSLKALSKTIGESVLKAKRKSEIRGLAIFLAALGAAILGRVALQWVPSVEPIIPIAVAIGMIYGAKEGFMLGSSAYIISNFFVWGLQGPWTIFQAIGAGIAGCLGGIFGRSKKNTWKDLVIWSVIGTVLFEILVTFAGFGMGIGLLGSGFWLFLLPVYFATSLPFMLAHIGTNVAFARLFAPLLKLRRKDEEIKVVSIVRSSGSGTTNVRMYKSSE